MAPNDIAEALGIPFGPGSAQSNDPYPLELPIRVRGLAGGGNLGADAACEPFLEDTHTVLVSPRGAVLRLAAPAAPGQMLTVSSPRLGTDLPARVIRYRGHADVKGYAEIEFTLETTAADQTAKAAAPAASAAGTRGQRCSAPAAIGPVPVMALADLLDEPPQAEQRQRNYEPFHAPAPPTRARARGAEAATQQNSKPKPRRNAPQAMDLEALLAAHKTAEQAPLQTQAAPPEFALHLLGPGELAAFATPRQPRKRWLAAAAAIVLTLGAAGTWAVMGSAPAMSALPEIAAFAPPGPPAEFATRNEVRLRLPVPLKQETESVPIATQLIPPLGPLQGRGVRARPGAPVPVSPMPEVRAASLVPDSTGRAEALAGLSAVSALPTAAPPPPVGGEVAPPRLVSQAPVVYPPMARQTHAEGTVVIDARIDETGHVAEMRVLSGPAILQQAAKESLAQWRYQPALLNGKPVATHLYVTIQFKR